MGNHQQTWTCDLCQTVNDEENGKCITCKTETINIKIQWELDYDGNDHLIDIAMPYSSSITLNDVFGKTMKEINKKLSPEIYVIYIIFPDSFIGHKKQIFNEYKNYGHPKDKRIWDLLCSQKITSFKKDDIIQKGLNIMIGIRCTHNIKDRDLSCKYLQNFLLVEKNEKYKEEKKDKEGLNGIELAMKCPIYSSMRIKSEFTEKNWAHLHLFNHFKDEYHQKEECKYGMDCKHFIKLERGGNRLQDRCHIKLFRHPPRTQRQINIDKNMNKFMVNTTKNQNRPRYDDAPDEELLLNELIKEVIDNGFKYDLCLVCSKENKCNHNVSKSNKNTLLSVVHQKMEHIRHKQMRAPLKDYPHCMLALVLYTGGECNYALCKTQRLGDYETWKFFDYSLLMAINLISNLENGSYTLYSGIGSVKLDHKEIKNGYFPTFVSTSWIKQVSRKFLRKKGGIMLEFDSGIKDSFYCCDVSWISKFPDECEILISRTASNNNNFVLSVLDEQDGIQTIRLSEKT